MHETELADAIDPVLPFAYVGGDPSLDFVNTVDWTDAGLVDERLASYDLLTQWAEGAGLVSTAYGATLRRRAATDPDAAFATLDAARSLRAVLHAVIVGVAAGAVPAEPLAELDRAVNGALARLRLAPRTGDATSPALTWRWEAGRDALDGPLLPVLRAAADLLVGQPRGKIRVCAGPRCGWVFVDRSRNGLRRWCRNDVCGAQAKARRYYARTKARGEGRG